MRWRIDNAGMTFLVSQDPEPVLDYDNKKQPKVDDNGEPVYSVQLAAIGEDGGQIVAVKFVGAPAPGIKQGSMVRVSGLYVTPWQREGKSGLTYRADKIEALSAHATKAGAA